MKIIGWLLLIAMFLQSCETKKEKVSLVKYNFKYSITNKQEITNIEVIECAENDYAKYWVFSYSVLKDLEKAKKTVFQFETKKGVTDSLVYTKKDVSEIQKNFKKHPCLLKSLDHIMNLSNEKILFYSKILYDIMVYESQLNGINTANYALDDVSITTILYNKCLYNENNVPEKYLNQANYLKVIPIWCEDKKTFPLYDKNDLIIK
nr:hypothetical protein [uncultured Flavobacterium sp.]